MKNKDILLLQSSCSFSSTALLILFNLKPLLLHLREVFFCRSHCALLIRSLDSAVFHSSCTFSSDSAALLMQNCQILDLSSPSRDLFFCFFFSCLFLLFNCSTPTHSQILYPRATLGKGSGYFVNHYQYHQSVLRRLCNTWHLTSGGYHAFSWTYIYIYIRYFAKKALRLSREGIARARGPRALIAFQEGCIHEG